MPGQAPPIPAAPTALYTTNPADHNQQRIVVSWTAVGSTPVPATAYHVYRNDAVLGGVLAAGPLTWIDTTTGGDVAYFTYYVTSVAADGTESAPSPSICNFSEKANDMICTLRRSLKDTPPDPRVQRWTDEDLWLAIRQGLSRVNAIPMGTDFNLDTAPADLFNYILVASRIAALRSQASLEVAKEFTMGIGGATINVNRSAAYNTLLSAEDSAFAAEIKTVKLNYVMKMVHPEGLLTNMMSFKIRTFSPRQYRIR